MKLKRKNIHSIESDDNDFDLDDDLDMKEDSNDDLNDFDDIDTSFGDDNSIAPMEKHKDLLLKLTDFDPYLKTQIMEWLGMYWDDEKGEYIRNENLKPMLNIQGARWGVNFLRTYTRDNNIITNFEREDYKSIMRSVIKTAHYVPAVRAEDFGLKNNSDILTFSNQLIDSIRLVLLGAGGKTNYSNLLQKAITRHENVNVSDQMGQSNNMNRTRKKGVLNSLKQYLGGN